MVDIYDYTAYYFSVVLCGSLTVFSIYVFFDVVCKSKFKWIKFMLFLCIIQNATTTFLAVALFWEINPFH